MVPQINQLAQDFACFTGDLLEDAGYFEPAVEIPRGARAPLFGIPGVGALIKPSLTGRDDLGAFETPAGQLYVNPGIGTFHLNVRFNCRPELTVFELGSPPYRLKTAATAT